MIYNKKAFLAFVMLIFNIMEEAYLTTIRDFEIAIRHTEWWRFKRIAYLQKQIEYYEGLLNTL